LKNAEKHEKSVVWRAAMNPLRSMIGKISLRLSYYHRPRNRLFLRQVNIGGLKLVVPSNEDVGRAIAYLGCYEPEETGYLLRTLRPDDVCFDVGANIGYYTTLMARAVDRGQVHAFEPDPVCSSLLELNVRINELSNASLNRTAIGAQPGRVQLVRSSDSGFNSLRDTGRRPVSGTVDVPMSTIDSYLEMGGTGRVDILKVDVEGAEGLVLEGARRLLADPERRPRLILLELFEPNQRPFEVGVWEIVDLLGGCGYEPFVVLEGRTIRYTRMHQDRCVNVFFRTDELTSGRVPEARIQATR
jgi:FkbM family methyltransferase